MTLSYMPSLTAVSTRREARRLHPNRPIYFMREYGQGKKRKATVLNRFFERAERRGGATPAE